MGIIIQIGIGRKGEGERGGGVFRGNDIYTHVYFYL